MEKAKKIRILLSIFLIFIILILGLLVVIGSYMTDVSIKRESNSMSSIRKTLAVHTDEEQKKSEEKANTLEKKVREEADIFLDKLKKQSPELISQESITAYDGIKLNAYSFKQRGQTDKWAVIVHGYHGKALNNSYFIKEYYSKGFNVLAMDMRVHGLSEGQWIGMGCTDRYDLISWLNKIIEWNSKAKIIMHGFSMGAASIMMASGENDFPSQVKVCIEDAGYSSDWGEMASKLKSIYKLPAFPFLHAANIMTKVKAGYYISEGNCIKSMQKNTTPYVFIHGEADDFNPYPMLQEVYDACTAEKVKVSVPRARHCMSAYVDPETYWQTIWAFIDEHL